LTDKPELLDSLVPDFSPHCRRLTPGPGYLEALSKENVSFIQTPIKRFTKDGIETVDGVHRPVDAVICSTGANVDYAVPFPIVSGDVNLALAWKPDGKFGFPYSYLGIATPGFPNLLFIHGPNASGHSGTLPHSVENQVTYIARVLRKVSGEGYVPFHIPLKRRTKPLILGSGRLCLRRRRQMTLLSTVMHSFPRQCLVKDVALGPMVCYPAA
jgi:cation diffusion facilitator CzcD-associated flavoprotein CzcO